MASKVLLLSLLFLTNYLHAMPGYYEPWGRDCDLSITPRTLSTAPKTRNPLNKSAESLILFHQNVISPADGPRSHFRPTSSSYMLHAIRKHGLIKGYLLGCDRLLRENSDPWVYRTISIHKKKYKFDPI